jgi:hypothetical protein
LLATCLSPLFSAATAAEANSARIEDLLMYILPVLVY